MNTAQIIITGIVQGVGFRPFLYNLARQHKLKGEIQNTGNLGVVLKLRAPDKNFDFNNFTKLIQQNAPVISYIEQIKIEPTDNSVLADADYNSLTIVPSGDAVGKSLTLPPDIALCESCLKDFNNPKLNRYYNYSFIACAQCGPRFTTMKSLPYDRNRSTMDEFPLCKGNDSCTGEYLDFNNRRFHAQTFGCKNCGPFYFTIKKGDSLPIDPKPDNIDEVASALLEGKIAAIKGIGGIFLVCLADNEQSIKKLRERKKDRKNKPFAIMVPNLSEASKYGYLTPKLSSLLTSFRRPIVLVEKKADTLPEIISPGLPNIGIILPYTGVHYLLFQALRDRPLVYTSGNISSLPMATNNQEILTQLQGIADIFYLHNRRIYQRCDDSVIRPVLSGTNIIRRSRGYVPEYIKLPFQSPFNAMVAVGPELNSTGAVARGSRIFPTQHIGNVTNLENYLFLESSINHMRKLLKIDGSDIGIIAHDLHPLFQSTRLAGKLAEDYNIGADTELNSGLFPVQHHHAHMATLMIDNKLDIEEEMIAITIDGVGYGRNGQPWGGEILTGGYKSFRRASHLTPIPMIGSDLCAKFPGRMMLSILLSDENDRENTDIFKNLNDHLKLENYFQQGKAELEYILKFSAPENAVKLKTYPMTSSFGRWLDAVSSLFNVCQVRTYRGEPAMRLEGYIWDGKPENHFDMDDYIKGNQILSGNLFRDYIPIVLKEYSSKKQTRNLMDLASSMVRDIAELFGIQAVKIARETGIKNIGVTGGVAFNEKIVNSIRSVVENNSYRLLQNKNISCGDAGISTGQLSIAGANKI